MSSRQFQQTIGWGKHAPDARQRPSHGKSNPVTRLTQGSGTFLRSKVITPNVRGDGWLVGWLATRVRLVWRSKQTVSRAIPGTRRDRTRTRATRSIEPNEVIGEADPSAGERARRSCNHGVHHAGKRDTLLSIRQFPLRDREQTIRKPRDRGRTIGATGVEKNASYHWHRSSALSKETSLMRSAVQQLDSRTQARSTLALITPPRIG